MTDTNETDANETDANETIDEEADDLLSLDEAVEALKSSRSTVYRWLRTGKLKGVKVGRQWRIHRDDIERFMRGESPRIDSPPGLEKLLDDLADLLDEHGTEPPDDEGPLATQAVRAMTLFATATRASHFSLEPHLSDDGEVGGWLRARIDGVLQKVLVIDQRALPALLEAWKVWAGCDPRKRHEIQHGRVVLGTSNGGRLELRLTFVPTALGESVSVTTLDPSAVERIDLDRLEYTPADRERIDDALGSPWGMVVVTGPTGSGKTTTLYACLTELAGPHLETISVEGVAEWKIPGVLQIPVQEDTGVTFTAAIRAALRCDVDVLMVSEIRDVETLELTPAAALAGHLVFTALHAPDSAGALTRMIEFGVEPHAVAEATRLVVSQRLVRRLCANCSVAQRPTDGDLERARQIALDGGLDWDQLPDEWRQPVGCPECGHTGYRGRRVIAETLAMKPTVSKALRDDVDVDELRRVAIDAGMTTFGADGVRRAARGETTLDEVWRVGAS